MTSGRLHDGCPWRAVVHIDERRGPRGGMVWVLTLECGHRAHRHQPTPTPEQLGRVLLPVVGRNERRPRGLEGLTAPHRVRCLFCKSETP